MELEGRRILLGITGSIAAYKAEISVSLLLQMRDRALTAYNELRNMNV